MGRLFADPFKFDAARENASSRLAFGTGVHFCLGANLARMELRTFFRELLPRLEWIELAEPAEYTAATFVGAPNHVRIRYRLRASLRHQGLKYNRVEGFRGRAATIEPEGCS